MKDLDSLGSMRLKFDSNDFKFDPHLKSCSKGVLFHQQGFHENIWQPCMLPEAGLCSIEESLSP